MSISEKPAEIWYEANCHCATIRYKVKLPPLETIDIWNCNCSICIKNGYLNVRPNRKDVVFQSGQETLQSYRFGERKYAHGFCPNCGSSLFVDPHQSDPDFVAVNVRMIKDVELDKLRYERFDGKTKLHPQYEPEKSAHPTTETK